MKAISIKQPWAWLIVNALKDIENRDWPTYCRGRVYVHAGKGYDDGALDAIEDMMPPDEWERLWETHGETLLDMERHPGSVYRGAILHGQRRPSGALPRSGTPDRISPGG